MQTFDTLNANLLDSDLLNVKSANHNLYYRADGEAEGEREFENEDNIEAEGEESQVSGGVPIQDLITFRRLVREKKSQLKAQYGKAYIDNRSTTERECKTIQVPKTRMVDKRQCINVPYTNWNPNINCTKVLGKEVCAGGFVGGTREECTTIKVPEGYTESEQVCINVPKLRLVWVSGWRKKWREFKRDGGLEQLKLQAKGLAPIVPEPEIDIYQNYSCQDLSDEFGIIAGGRFGTADAEAIKSFTKRGCQTKPTPTQTDETENETSQEEVLTESEEVSSDEENTGVKPKPKPKKNKKKPTKISSAKISSNKTSGVPNEVIIGLAVAFVLVGGFLLINRK
jgi:hypothetical protein